MAARIVPEGGWAPRLKPFKTPRVQNVKHRQFVKSLPCICCLVEGVEIQADDPMHLPQFAPPATARSLLEVLEPRGLVTGAAQSKPDLIPQW